MKAVTLPESTWDEICVALEGSSHATLIREQVHGGVRVRATRGGAVVSIKAPKGGDLRGVVEALSGAKP